MLLKKEVSCFENLSMNGILSIILQLFPFVLSLSKDSKSFTNLLRIAVIGFRLGRLIAGDGGRARCLEQAQQ